MAGDETKPPNLLPPNHVPGRDAALPGRVGKSFDKKTGWYEGSGVDLIFVTFKILRPANDGVGENPIFTFHAMTEIDGVYYDPSYNISNASLQSDQFPLHISGATLRIGTRDEYNDASTDAHPSPEE